MNRKNSVKAPQKKLQQILKKAQKTKSFLKLFKTQKGSRLYFLHRKISNTFWNRKIS